MFIHLFGNQGSSFRSSLWPRYQFILEGFRRGMPEEMLSDNGTNFVGAD